MQRKKSKMTGLLGSLVAAGTVLLVWSAASFAGTPTLGTDCGTTAIAVGSDTAGKVTIGTPDPLLPYTGTCTLTFGAPYPNAPACTAMDETNGGGFPAPAGARTTPTSLTLGSTVGWAPGDVISYSCLDY
jgi:hypothetical protein